MTCVKSVSIMPALRKQCLLPESCLVFYAGEMRRSIWCTISICKIVSTWLIPIANLFLFFFSPQKSYTANLFVVILSIYMVPLDLLFLHFLSYGAMVVCVDNTISMTYDTEQCLSWFKNRCIVDSPTIIPSTSIYIFANPDCNNYSIY
jgi:hypothetical protein